MKLIETTLLILRDGENILLARKKRGFGKDKYNGVGGKLEPGESIEEAMIRECEEEILVTPTEYEKMGIIEFSEYINGEKAKLVFHLYFATKWIGEPKESEEMDPKWFNIEDIPYDDMFPDDKYWLPLVLEGIKIKAHFEFDEDFNILSHSIKGENHNKQYNKRSKHEA